MSRNSKAIKAVVKLLGRLRKPCTRCLCYGCTEICFATSKVQCPGLSNDTCPGVIDCQMLESKSGHDKQGASSYCGMVK